MLIPPFLQPEDRIAIVATARKITRPDITYSLEILKRWGLEVTIGKNLLKVSHQFAGTDNERLSDFQQALDDPTIRAIICARGGYGTLRIIDKLLFDKFLSAPKWIVGYSDITVLHSHLHTKYNVASVHATMPINFPNNSHKAIESLRRALFGEPLSCKCLFHPLNRNGTASGQVVGGNLSLLHTLSGTPSDIDTKGKILFIEDIDEYLYHIDRMMLNLKRSGKLAGLAGLVSGCFTKMKDNEIPFGKKAEDIICEAVEEYSYPICFNFPVGHINDNRALIIGATAELSVSEDKTTFKYITTSQT